MEMDAQSIYYTQYDGMFFCYPRWHFDETMYFVESLK